MSGVYSYSWIYNNSFRDLPTGDPIIKFGTGRIKVCIHAGTGLNHVYFKMTYSGTYDATVFSSGSGNAIICQPGGGGTYDNSALF